MKQLRYIIYVPLMSILFSCGNSDSNFDASGNFEAEDVIVAAEGAGKIMKLEIKEGQLLKAGQVVGYIDTTQLHLRKKQLQLSIEAALARIPDMSAQLAALKTQVQTTEHEKSRFEKLLQADAATQKQVDDLTAQLELLKRQEAALRSSLATTTKSIRSETQPLQAQIDQINDQIAKSVIRNPMDGTVLVQYAEENEVTNMGKALYKIADVANITLRAYISGTQLPQLKLGDKVEILVDDNEDYKKYEGTVQWVSDKAEFTPKTIQTKEERANLVYAIKVGVKNDGYLKIGMYGEVNFIQ
ncbi:MAG: HlyD family secretion protein [Cyclobacteriaceae bacterium]